MRPVSSSQPQSTDSVFMVRPSCFGFNEQTAGSNAFQSAPAQPAGDDQAQALAEFDSFVRQLRAEGVDVLVAADDPVPPRPDAVFPNNWISFHADGTLVLYPMQAPNRRLERRAGLIDWLLRQSGFPLRRTLDLSGEEQNDVFLEGTGSLVLDHVGRVAYAAPSSRTDPGLVRRWCDEMSYDCELFAATDASGMPYYHTNVMLSIGARFAVIVAEALPAADRERVLARLQSGDRDVIQVSRAQANDFCANILQLSAWDEALGDCSVLAMSRRAHAAFSDHQLKRLQRSVDAMVVAPLDRIEQVGGGGARCMLAEIFR